MKCSKCGRFIKKQKNNSSSYCSFCGAYTFNKGDIFSNEILPKEIIIAMWEEGCRITYEMEKDRRCEYCRRWFLSKRGKSIHLHSCPIKKLLKELNKIRRRFIGITYITPHRYGMSAFQIREINQQFIKVRP